MTLERWRAIAAGLAVALVASVATAVAFHHDDSGAAAHALTLARAEQGALTAARSAAVHLTTYDYRSIATDFSWVDGAGTAKFRKEYAKISAPVKEYVAQLKVHAVGTVDDAAARVTDASHVTVLLFVDQTLTSAASTERKLDTPRIAMTMVRQHGVWLVDQVALRNLVAS